MANYNPSLSVRHFPLFSITRLFREAQEAWPVIPTGLWLPLNLPNCRLWLHFNPHYRILSTYRFYKNISTGSKGVASISRLCQWRIFHATWTLCALPTPQASHRRSSNCIDINARHKCWIILSTFVMTFPSVCCFHWNREAPQGASIPMMKYASAVFWLFLHGRVPNC